MSTMIVIENDLFRYNNKHIDNICFALPHFLGGTV